MATLRNAVVKALAREAGLDVVGCTTADPFPDITRILSAHIDAGHTAGFDWFDHDRARAAADPRNLQGTVRGIVACGLPYWTIDPGKPADGISRGTISRYARGLDYHVVLKRRMKRLRDLIADQLGREVDARFLVDTAMISDRTVAARAGVGWFGKHSCLIVPGRGSWVLLGDLLLDVEVEPDVPLVQDCGRCTICIDRCPTGAIVAPYTVSAPRCLSFQTIEQRGPIPRELRAAMGDLLFGCDICQEVCPYTRAAHAVDDPDVLPRALENAYPALPWLLSMTEAEFRDTYRGTPVIRAKRPGLARNAAIALGNVGQERDVPDLVRALREHDAPLVRAAAAWALPRLAGLATASPHLDHARRADPDPVVRDEAELALAGA